MNVVELGPDGNLSVDLDGDVDDADEEEVFGANREVEGGTPVNIPGTFVPFTP